MGDGMDRATARMHQWRFMMATWKRLTSADREEVDVNMEQVAYMRRYGNKNQTTLYFVGGMSDKPMISGSRKRQMRFIWWKPSVL